MKKLFLIGLLLLAPAIAFAGAVEKVDITAENQWSDGVKLRGKGILVVEDTGSMSMTVTLQMYIGGSWVDSGNTYTSEVVQTLDDGCDRKFRVGVKTGGYTSGTATAYIISK